MSCRGPKPAPLTQGTLESFCLSPPYILEAPARVWPEFQQGEARPLTVSTFVDSCSLFCLLSPVALNDLLFADNPLVVLGEQAEPGSSIVSYLGKQKQSS